MSSYKGKTALVTGASSGIGAAFARELARRGMHLILVARSADKLRQLAADLTATYGVRAEVLPCDLGADGAVERVCAEVAQRGLSVDLLVNNAGFASHGRFEELAAARDRELVMVNVAALVDLAHAFVPQLLARRGAVINVASILAYTPTPYMAVYGATKAFVTSFSAALAEEYRGRGLRVLALCPGATDTGFFEVAGSDSMVLGRKRSPKQVVSTALRALERGQSVAIDGAANALMAISSKLAPFALAALVTGWITRPRPAAKPGAAARHAR
ncbi:MAG: SDR family oxidoreductase [Chloroflexales bacterium]